MASRTVLMLLLSSFGVLVQARTFVDDDGITHTTALSRPTIAAGVWDGISLVHFGMGHDQFKATFGERATSGSNANGAYANGNSIDFLDAGPHHERTYDPTHWPVDPTAAEQAVLAQAVDLSPSCSNVAFWCAEFNIPAMDAAGWPDFILHGAYDGGWALTDEVKGNASANGVPIIVVKNIYDSGVKRGFIELLEVYEKLAVFLGVSAADKHAAADKQHLCSAVTSFKHIAKEAHRKGVRALAAYAPYSYSTVVEANTVGGWLYSPYNDEVLLMLEELGMPLLHVEGGSEQMLTADYSKGLMFASDLHSSVDPTRKYPVDFWLYDVRVTLDFTSSAFATAWPHAAVVANQGGYWPSGGHVHSYLHAVEILTQVGNALAGAVRLHPATECTPITGGVDGQVHRTDGLIAGQYACNSAVEYGWCSAHSDLHEHRKSDSPPPAPPPQAVATTSPEANVNTCDDGLATGAIAGIAIGCAVAGIIIGGALTFMGMKSQLKGTSANLR